jgi:hypothetical protein
LTTPSAAAAAVQAADGVNLPGAGFEFYHWYVYLSLFLSLRLSSSSLFALKCSPSTDTTKIYVCPQLFALNCLPLTVRLSQRPPPPLLWNRESSHTSLARVLGMGSGDGAAQYGPSLLMHPSTQALLLEKALATTTAPDALRGLPGLEVLLSLSSSSVPPLCSSSLPPLCSSVLPPLSV